MTAPIMTDNKAASSLSPQATFGLAAVAATLAAVGSYMLLVKPGQDHQQQLRSELETKSLKLSAIQQQAADIGGLRKQVEQLQKADQRFVTALPRKADFSAAISQMRALVGQAGARVEGINFIPTPVAVNGTAQPGELPIGVQPMEVTVKLSGTYAQIFSAIRSLEAQDRFNTPAKLNLQAEGSPKGDQAIGDPIINSEFNMTVYTYDSEAAAKAKEAAAKAAALKAEAGGTK